MEFHFRNTLILIVGFFHGYVHAQFLDPCFTSAASATSFVSSANLADVGNNADLCVWTGTTWTGDWPGANLTITPPINSANCRAIWQGSGTSWTTGGEGFGIRLSSPLVTGVTYNFPVTYVSHGTGSTGSFTPKVYTNSTPSTAAPAVLLGLMPAAGTTWTTNTLSFTATAAQNGHVWLIFGTWPNLSSGFINSWCPGCTTIPLPVELNHFNATAQSNRKVKIDWSTTSEINNNYFMVQRSSNAVDFEDVERVEGSFNSNVLLEYQIFDDFPLPGTSYYRLKQVDIDGSISYSEVKSVDLMLGNVYPNPTTDIIYIPDYDLFKNLPAGQLHIQVLSNTGQLLLMQAFTPAVNLSQLAPGSYILQVKSNNGDVYSYPFMKQ